MALPAELKSSDCPLLRHATGLKASELIEQYNALVRTGARSGRRVLLVLAQSARCAVDRR